MVKLFIDAAKWAWSERTFLGQRFEKYTKLSDGKQIKFDGPAVKAWVIKWEPSIYEVAKSGFTVSSAIKVVMGKAFAPHKQTFEEEQAVMNRPDGAL